MGYDSAKHHRRSVRLPYHDYAGYGWYYVTLCAKHKKYVFGRIEQGEVRLNVYGRIVAESWEDVSAHPPQPSLDAFIVMPNHLHGIVVLPRQAQAGEYNGMVAPGSLGATVRGFKSSVTRTINLARSERNLPPVQVWQRNYYEHIIRDEADLGRIRQYITENPVRWADDELYLP